MNRPATARAYFKLETAWIEHWPFERGKREIQKLAPAMCRLGILGPVRMKVKPGVSFLLDPRDLVSATILRTGEWQPEIWDSLSPALSEGSVFLDVGAHIGYFSMKAARKVGSTGHVLSFEPNPETLWLLRDNVAANNAQNVVVEPVACTDHEQTLTLYAASIVNTGASSLARQNADISAGEAPRPYSVRGRMIDDVVRELNLTRVDAIKVDVEGAELSVLRGAFETLKRFHPKLIVEMAPSQLASFQTTVDDLTVLIKAAGYNRSKLLDDTDWEWTAQDARHMASVIRIADASTSDQLIRGFHDLERNAWRWTAARFTAALPAQPSASQNGARLVLKFIIPDIAFSKLNGVSLAAKVGDASIAPERFTTPGEHEYRRDVPASALQKDMVNVDFSLDKSLPPSAADTRELGVIVTSIALEMK